MKKLLIIALMLAGCSAEVSEEKAKAKTIELLELLKAHEYEKIKPYYAASSPEEMEIRIKRFKEIESASGDIKSFELLSSDKTTIDDRNILELKYQVTCTRLSLIHSFIVANEEGEHKVLSHNISNL